MAWGNTSKKLNFSGRSQKALVPVSVQQMMENPGCSLKQGQLPSILSATPCKEPHLSKDGSNAV